MDVNLVAPAGGGTETGIGRYVDRLRAALAASGASVRVAALRYPPGAGRRAVLRALPIGVEGGARGGVYHLPQILGASLLLVRPPRPAVVTVHDLGVLFCPEDRGLTSRLDRAVLRPSLLGLRRADRLIAVSAFTRDGLLRAGFAPERVAVVHHGIDHDLFRPGSGTGAEDVARLAAEHGLDLPPERPIVLYVGNEQPRKNLVRLVEALARVKAAGIPFRWVKVGGSGYAAGRAELRRRIGELGLEGDIAFVERVSDADLARFYRAASVYVQPSVWEGFGFPPLEAMASGTPVVAADAAALPEVCGEAATLVDPRSVEALAEAIGGVLGDPGRRERMRRAGLARAAGFTWEHAAGLTREVYAAS